MEGLREQMSFLSEQGLFDSAELLGYFLICAPSANNDLSPSTRAENMILLADAYYGKKEYRRALVKYKIGLCHLAVHDTRSALSEIEGISSKARTLRINLTLARLYRVTGYDRAATAAYRECLRQCPYVLEAIIALAELGVSAKEIQSLFPQGQSKSARPTAEHVEPIRWLQRFAEAHCAVSLHDYKAALESLNNLGQRFPNNLHIILETAKVEVALGKTEEAIHDFEKARQIDQYNLTSMDEYAMLLRNKAERLELNRLVHDLLNVDASRPEVWVASAVHWEMRDDKVRALTYVEKSLQVDDRHTSSYIVKGNLSLSMNRPEAAVLAFRKAQTLRPDLRSYQGLVRALLAIPKHKDALYAARDAMRTMPNSAKALTLVGDVYAANPDGREKARRFYESSLRLEPGYLGAVLNLASLHASEGRNGEAITLLQRHLKNWADDSLHTKLAQILAANNKLGESLSHYQAALSINPHNEAAKKGLERLEKQMKGVDPDALEEEEENEGEDVDGDQQEEEFL